MSQVNVPWCLSVGWRIVVVLSCLSPAVVALVVGLKGLGNGRFGVFMNQPYMSVIVSLLLLMMTAICPWVVVWMLESGKLS